jgi:hypothetical protein
MGQLEKLCLEFGQSAAKLWRSALCHEAAGTLGGFVANKPGRVK